MRAFDTALYKLERLIVGWAMVVMTLVVALDVVHRVATRQNGLSEKIARALLPASMESAAPHVGTVLVLLIALLFFYGVFRTRQVAHKGKALLFAGITTAACYGGVELYVRLVPNGLIWSQTFGLALMIWAGFLGASLAARDRRHLALDAGPKLVPYRARPYVIAAGHLVTAGFCGLLVVLAIWSVTQHFNDWTNSGYEGGTFPALAIPKWAVFLAIPYALGVMAMRFMGDAAAALRGQDTSDDEVATFRKLGGLDKDK